MTSHKNYPPLPVQAITIKLWKNQRSSEKEGIEKRNNDNLFCPCSINSWLRIEHLLTFSWFTAHTPEKLLSAYNEKKKGKGKVWPLEDQINTRDRKCSRKCTNKKDNKYVKSPITIHQHSRKDNFFMDGEMALKETGSAPGQWIRSMLYYGLGCFPVLSDTSADVVAI